MENQFLEHVQSRPIRCSAMAWSKTTVFIHGTQCKSFWCCFVLQKGQSPDFRSVDDGITVIRTLSICINELSVKNKMKTYTTWSHTWGAGGGGGLGWAPLCFGLSFQIAKVTYFIKKAMQVLYNRQNFSEVIISVILQCQVQYCLFFLFYQSYINLVGMATIFYHFVFNQEPR